MAIVTAIIGLLVGVVVVSMSYIKNSQLTQTAIEGKYFLDAVRRFEDKYGVRAGDMPNASTYWTGAGNGNGNGIVASDNYPETFYTFQHLANAGFIEGGYTGVAGGGHALHAIIGRNVPAGPVPKSGFVFFDIAVAEVPAGHAFYFAGFYRNPLHLGKSMTAWLPEAPLLTPAQALGIDEKYDNGMPGLGNIRTRHSGAQPDCTTSTVAEGAMYKTSVTDVACTLIFTQP